MAAHIYTGTITYGNNQWHKAMYDFISQYDNRFTLIDSNYSIQFADKFRVKFRTSVNSETAIPFLDMNDNEIAYYPRDNDSGHLNNVIFITDGSNFASYQEGSEYKWFWVRQGNEDFFSLMYRYWHGWNIEDSNSSYQYFIRVSTQQKNYCVPKNFNYSVLSPKIMFANNNIMIDASSNPMKIDCLKSCSTVTPGSNVAVGGKNYYAVGTNTLVEVEA